VKTFELRFIERKVVVYHVQAETEQDAVETLHNELPEPVDEWPIETEGPFTDEILPDGTHTLVS